MKCDKLSNPKASLRFSVMRVLSIEIKNFFAIRETKVVFGPYLTCLVGSKFGDPRHFLNACGFLAAVACRMVPEWLKQKNKSMKSFCFGSPETGVEASEFSADLWLDDFSTARWSCKVDLVNEKIEDEQILWSSNGDFSTGKCYTPEHPKFLSVLHQVQKCLWPFLEQSENYFDFADEGSRLAEVVNQMTDFERTELVEKLRPVMPNIEKVGTRLASDGRLEFFYIVDGKTISEKFVGSGDAKLINMAMKYLSGAPIVIFPAAEGSQSVGRLSALGKWLYEAPKQTIISVYDYFILNEFPEDSIYVELVGKDGMQSLVPMKEMPEFKGSSNIERPGDVLLLAGV